MFVAGITGGAHAQQSFTGLPQLPGNVFGNGGPSGPINPAQDYLLVAQPPNGGTYALRLGNFASAQDLAATNATLAATNGALGSSLAATNAAIGHEHVLMLRGVAMASAFNITAPNPGDRFSLNVGGASFGGEAVGSVSAAWQVAPRALLYTGVAQSSGQTMVKGGLSISLP